MLKVDGLDVFYGDAQALDNVSRRDPQGAIVAIVGANGAGKTSLIRTIGGMVKPTRGSIRFRDNDIAGLPSYKVCNLGIGQVAEGPPDFPEPVGVGKSRHGCDAAAGARHARQEPRARAGHVSASQ